MPLSGLVEDELVGIVDPPTSWKQPDEGTPRRRSAAPTITSRVQPDRSRGDLSTRPLRQQAGRVRMWTFSEL